MKILLSLLLLSFTLLAEKEELGDLEKDWLGYPKKPKQSFECTVPQMIGKKPLEVCNTIKLLQEIVEKKQMTMNEGSQRLILHGPPGTGKSTVARKIADLTNSAFIPVKTSTIVGKFAGQGAETIEKIFKDALKQSQDEDRPVVIFFDEIDQIAKESESESRSEHNSALRTLWLNFDETKNNPNICIIGATNDVESLHPTLKSRLGRLVKFENPDLESRKALLTFFLNRYNYTLNEKTTHELAKKTEILSERDFEEVVRELALTARLNNAKLTTNMLDEAFEARKEQKKIKAEDKETRGDKVFKYGMGAGGSASAVKNVLEIGKFLWDLFK